MEDRLESVVSAQGLELAVARFKDAARRFDDERSRKQIGVYLTYAIDTYAKNALNLRHWYEYVAPRWYDPR